MLHRSVLNPGADLAAPPSAGPSGAAAEPGRCSARSCQTGAAAKTGWHLPGLGLDGEADWGVEQPGGADHPELLTEGQPSRHPRSSILPGTTSMAVPSRSYVCRPPQLSGLLAWCSPFSAKTAAAQVPTASRAYAPSACGSAVTVCFQAERTMAAPAIAPFLARIRRAIFRRRPREVPAVMRIPPRTLYFHSLTVYPRGRWSSQPNRGGQGCGT